MLQIYGNWVNDKDIESKAPIMEKPVIFQLYDIGSNDLNADLLQSIHEFLVDPMYSKVFHYYSVDAHTINNALHTLSPTLKLNGFAADTMHLARLLNAGVFTNFRKFCTLHFSSLLTLIMASCDPFCCWKDPVITR